MSLHFGDTIQIDAPQQRVWDFVIDPQRLGRCGPGVESIEVIDEMHYRAIVKVGIGQFRARFNVQLEMSDIDPIEEAHVRARGQAPGTAVDATAKMSLQPVDEGRTAMTWEADVNVSGQMAVVGSRLIQWTANRLIAQTFDCVRSTLVESADSTQE